MLTILSTNLKATKCFVAFCFLILIVFNRVAMAKAKDSLLIKQQVELNAQIVELKKKTTSLLLLGQKHQAFELIEQWLSAHKDKDGVVAKANELKMLVSTSFLKQESQDYFELASTQTVNQPKEALKNAQKCIAIEIENILCLWVEAKVHNKSNNSKYTSTVERILALNQNNPLMSKLVTSLNKNTKEFLDLKLSTNEVNDIYNSKLIYTILEFERSYRVKNYSLATEMLIKIEEMAPDYIDLIIFKNQLALIDTEDDDKKLKKINNIYQKRCQAVTPDIARKYFFDIDFCKRSLD